MLAINKETSQVDIDKENRSKLTILRSRAGGVLIAIKEQYDDELDLNVVVYCPNSQPNVWHDELEVRFFETNEPLADHADILVSTAYTPNLTKNKLLYAAYTQRETTEILLPQSFKALILPR